MYPSINKITSGHKVELKIKYKQQKINCKKLSIPKYIREKYKNFEKIFY